MIVMLFGVSGCGKTTIGREIAEACDWMFVDADDLHPECNIAKMRHGSPLADDDRASWLASIAKLLADWSVEGRDGVLACSALKREYRDKFRRAAPSLLSIFLEADAATVVERVRRREEHFMPTALIDSQFLTLEVPEPDEAAVKLAATATPSMIVSAIIRMIDATRTMSPQSSSNRADLLAKGAQ